MLYPMPMRRSTREEMPNAVRIGDPPPLVSMWRDRGVLAAGCFRLGDCTVIVAHEPMKAGYRWHLSISHAARYPTWDEIAEARYQLLDDALYMVMILPPSAEYVNANPNCFHLHELPEAAEVTEAT